MRPLQPFQQIDVNALLRWKDWRARESGFDGVELFAAYHALVDQFWTPWSNRRDDRWFIVGLAVSMQPEMEVSLSVEAMQEIVAYIDEPTRPPPLAPARDPPAWGSNIDGGEVMDPQAQPAGIVPLAQPEPEYIFDQRIPW